MLTRIRNSGRRPNAIWFGPLIWIAFLGLSGCSASKYLKENESFYAGSEIRFHPHGKVGGKKALKKELEAMLVPAPNTEIFGMRPGVWLFFRERDEGQKKGLKAFIRRKFGQIPVLISDIKPEHTAKMLEGQIQNEGYFKSEVTHEIKERKKQKESKVIYNVELHPAYRLRNINFPSPKDSLYARIVRTLKTETLLKENQRYNLARLQAEQQRIEAEVENFGLFYFDDKHLIFQADSTVGTKQVDLDLKLEEGIPERARRIYKIGEVNIYPDYTIDGDTAKLKTSLTRVDSINYYNTSRMFKPSVITRIVNLREGRTYRSDDHQLTLSHLMDLGVFKFVNIQYAEMGPDSSALKTDILLTPLKKRSIRAEFQTVSKSNNYVGPGLQVTFTDRNFLRGAELFQLRMNTSYEVQLSKSVSTPLNFLEVGAEASLTVPRFLSPIHIDYSNKKYLPKTDFRVGINFQDRAQFFTLNSVNVSAGYVWRESAYKSHELYPIDINFVQTFGQSTEFDAVLEKNRFLQSSFDDQFIIGSRYSYMLNTQMKPDLVGEFEERKLKTHSLFFNGTIQLAGNLLNALQKQAHKGEEDRFEIFRAPYSQFVRADIDFRHYWQLDEHNKLASRLLVGAGYAYGNSSYYDPELERDVRVLPFVKQFYVGGSNSLRGFPARSVGPGSYSIMTDTAFFPPPKEIPPYIDQRGDIKLEANVELRFDIIKAFKGALFVDAGNIWLFEEDPSRPGSEFDPDTFLSQLAVDAGVGLRFDFNFFVLRFDTAIPLRVPNNSKDSSWVIRDIDFGSSLWRGNSLIFNIAIGYPF
jgi:outer membrane protein insertion porin family